MLQPGDQVRQQLTTSQPASFLRLSNPDDLRADTQINETVRRPLIHRYLAQRPLASCAEIQKGFIERSWKPIWMIPGWGWATNWANYQLPLGAKANQARSLLECRRGPSIHQESFSLGFWLATRSSPCAGLGSGVDCLICT